MHQRTLLRTIVVGCTVVLFAVGSWLPRTDGTERNEPTEASLKVGLAEADITPDPKAGTVYLAGFGQNRVATGIHDRLFARAVTFESGGRKIALASVDLVGFFHRNVNNVRRRLPGFDYVLVSSTHNHEGPDTIGIWGPTPFRRGVDPDYLQHVESQIVRAIKAAEENARPVTCRIGVTRAPELLSDGREPYVKHDELTVLQFVEPAGGKAVGLLVQWNCHPETLGSRNKLISSDFVGYTVSYLRKRHQCPVAYFTGTVGGLLSSLSVPVRDEQGRLLQDGTFEKTERYGELVGMAAEKALAAAEPIRLDPLQVRSRIIYVPMENRLYRAAHWMKVLDRQVYRWTGDPSQGKPITDARQGGVAIRTEVAVLQFGDLSIAAIPGEIYPELVLGKVQDPVDPGADFPDAPIEPAVYPNLPGPHRMLIGLANDEIGYILPKRQWDVKRPFCYGRKKAQYGETNSVGPDAGPIICNAIHDLLRRGQ